MTDTKAQRAAAPSSVERRNFLVKTGAAILGGIAALFPIGVGLFTFADPLRRRSTKQGDGYLRITSLDSVPDDGIPRQFAVLSDRTDAWNRFPNEPIRRDLSSPKERRENARGLQCDLPTRRLLCGLCRRAKLFQCPCHNSAFQLDGSKIEPSPSPRPMDKLNCDIRDESGQLQIWVEFKDFLPGREEPIAKV